MNKTFWVAFSLVVAVGSSTFASRHEALPVRVDVRTSFGGRLATAVETIGTPSGDASEAFDSTAQADGWFSLAKEGQTSSICIRNGIGVLGGRLAAGGETEFAGATNLVRHNVVVPNGATAVFPFGTILKFTENARIVAETGGKIVFRGVVLADALDDSVGGDTDLGHYASMDGAVGDWVSAAEHAWSDISFIDGGQAFCHPFRWTAGLSENAATYGELPRPADDAVRSFKGWYTAATGGSVVSAGTAVVAGTRTLYARWNTASNAQTVTFDANGGICGTTTRGYAQGDTYGELPVATMGTYSFLGWWTKKGGGTQVTAKSKVTTAAARTLYAHWMTNQMVVFDANGGKCSTASTNAWIGGTYQTLPTPKRSGQAFLGWFTKAEGGSKVTETSTVTTAAKRTLYAHWTDQQVTTFKANGGYPATQKTTNTIYADYGTFPAVKYSGHALVGWFNAPEGGKRIYTNSTVTLAATRTLYAQWTTNQVTTFKGNGGTPEIQKTTNAIYTHYGTLPDATWENHVFLGWFNHPTKGKRVYTNSTVTLAATRSLYAHWTDQQVVTFKGNGGTPKTQATTNTMGTAYGTLPTPKKSGYAFLGWFTKAEGGTEVTAVDMVTAATSRTLYAHWTDQQVTTFLGNGGTPETQATTNTIYAKYAFPPTPAWDGHTFQGWYNAAEGGKRVYTNSTVTLAATRTLYAHWTTGKGFAITAIAVGSSDGDEGPAPRAVRGEDRAENVCRLRFELSAGTEYEIQWTPSMAGEWESVERLMAETDGEVEVEIEVPGGEKGFFRVVVFDDGGEAE